MTSILAGFQPSNSVHTSICNEVRGISSTLTVQNKMKQTFKAKFSGKRANRACGMKSNE